MRLAIIRVVEKVSFRSPGEYQNGAGHIRLSMRTIHTFSGLDTISRIRPLGNRRLAVMA